MSELIYNQTKIPKKQWRYGFRSSAATGCGWIAAYNALQLLGKPEDPEKLIRYFTRHFPLVNGNFGTFLPNLVIFFKKKGYKVKVTPRRKKYDETAKNCDVCILFYWWHEKRRLGAHYVTLHYKDGRFTGYNTFRNSNGPDDYGPSLEAFLKRQKFFLTMLIGIGEKPTQHT